MRVGGRVRNLGVILSPLQLAAREIHHQRAGASRKIKIGAHRPSVAKAQRVLASSSAVRASRSLRPARRWHRISDFICRVAWPLRRIIIWRYRK